GCDNFEDDGEAFTAATTTTTSTTTSTTLVESEDVSRIGDGSPSTIRQTPLTEKSCVEDWVCFNWLACKNGIEQRECRDRNSCGTIVNRPITVRECEPDVLLVPPKEEEKKVGLSRKIVESEIEQESLVSKFVRVSESRSFILLTMIITLAIAFGVYTILMKPRKPKVGI
ncbi:MAG: hypothetical protein AABW46_04145, partial [Nanoarchaeota archaeon]